MGPGESLAASQGERILVKLCYKYPIRQQGHLDKSQTEGLEKVESLNWTVQ
jgi:hypothetical protein